MMRGTTSSVNRMLGPEMVRQAMGSPVKLNMGQETEETPGSLSAILVAYPSSFTLVALSIRIVRLRRTSSGAASNTASTSSRAM